jgi:putative ABC transport system substrate-binding protein
MLARVTTVRQTRTLPLTRRQACAWLVAGGLPADAASAQGKRHRIAFLGISSAEEYAPRLAAFIDAMRALGYEEGRNLVIDYRWADNRQDRLPELAAQLVRLEPEVIVTHATGVRAAQQATTTIPIVMGSSADPVRLGLIRSLAKPGGNTTGVASQMVDLSAKRLELLKELQPRLTTVAVLSYRTPAAQDSLAETEAAARQLGLRVRPHWIDAAPESLDAALTAILKDQADGLIVWADPLTVKHSARLAAFAIRHKLPSIGGAPQFADDGGLIAYGGNFLEGWRVAARYVDRILKGARPADLPVEQPTSFELVLNLKTARSLGLAVPQSVLLRANVVIR